MKRIFLISILLGFGILCAFSQDSIVSIPDTAFLHTLILRGVDTNGDSLISYEEAAAVETLILDDRYGYGCYEPNNMTSLTGIEAFVNLDTLCCSCGKLSSLNLFANPKLKYLRCSSNELTNLELPNNAPLTELNCGENQLTRLDVSNITDLQRLSCFWNDLSIIDIDNCERLKFMDLDGNKLTQLDVSTNRALLELRCEHNELTALDVSFNTSLTDLYCGGNEITSLDISNNTDLTFMWLVDMPSLHEICVWKSFNPDSIDIQRGGSPNVYFTTECVYNNDTIVFIPDTAFLYALLNAGVDTNGDSLISYEEAEVIITLDVQHKGIQDLKGINAFINLDTLICIEPNLTSLDISNLGGLVFLETGVSGQPIGSGCGFTSLDLSHNTELEVYNGHSNLDLTNLNISKNTQLKYLDVGCNFSLENLDVSNNTQLLALDCHGTILTSLDVSNNTALTELVIPGIESLHQVCVWEGFPESIADTSYSPNVYFTTECGTNFVTIPDTAFIHALIEKEVDTNGDSLISYLEAETVTSLDVGGTNDEWGSIRDLTGIEAFLNLDSLCCCKNQLTSLDVSKNTLLVMLECSENQLTKLDVSNNPALTELRCGDNQLTSLDVSNDGSLIALDCNTNQLTSLNVFNNINLEILSCSGNSLTKLDVSNNSNLKSLFCGCYGTFGYAGNQLTSIDISHNIALEALDISINQITSLDLSNNINLKWLNCAVNHLSNLDVSNNTALVDLHCGVNQLTSLDISNNTALKSLNCDNNQLTNLDISANTSLQYVTISNLPSLHEVCVWTTPFPPDSVVIDITGSPSICFETDCNGVCDPADVEDLWIGDLSIYPNPTYTLLSIETITSELIVIEITSLNGKLILSKELEGTSHQLDLSSFQKGVYIITIRSKDFITTRKVVKL